MTPALPAVVTLLNVLLLLATMMMVGAARGRYQIKAPATTGHPDFERVFRVQMNTLEATVMFLPALWLAATFWNAYYAGYVGLVWIVGRVWYVLAYARAAERRGPGFLLGFLANLVLIGGAAWGIVRPLLN